MASTSFFFVKNEAADFDDLLPLLLFPTVKLAKCLILSRTTDIPLSSIYWNLGGVQMELEKYKESDESLGLASKGIHHWRLKMDVGVLRGRQGRWKESLKLLKEAKAMFESLHCPINRW